MADNKDYAELVVKAQFGDKQCRNRLAEVARMRLRGYVHRLTLQEDLAQDIVQETMLEMFKVFDKLKKTDQFWNWLYGIAFNKVRSHYGKQWRQKTVRLSDKQYKLAVANAPDGLAEMVAAEWKEIVVRSMQELEPRHRAVLTMRCYDRMPYSQIAKVMGCSEFGVRALFYRAKKALAKKLSRYGLGKGALLASLVLFGKLTATSKEAAAAVSVPAATVKVGTPAALAAVAASKTTIVIAAAGALGVGTLMATSGPDKTMAAPNQNLAANPAPIVAAKTAGEYWYFFPEGTKAPVMTRFVKGSQTAGQSYCRWMQDAQANYYFDSRKHTVLVNNYRRYNTDLSVWRLPTDPPELTQFLSRVEGQRPPLEYVCADGPGLMAVVQQGKNGSSLWTTRHFHVLKEEYFRSGWPPQAKVVDNRDPMHKRGWTYFRISGHIGDEMVLGTGRMPFVYGAARQNYPWLRLEVGNRLRIVDNGSDAVLYDAGGGVAAGYEGCTFFKGMPRPWMGLHTIDIVRRDAAEKGVWFETSLEPGEEKAKVTLSCKQGKLDYTIDMQTDVVDAIVISTADGKEGQLRFSYLQDIDRPGDEFIEPEIGSYYRKRQENSGALWLLKLSNGQW
ncbi:MAG: RNA polymerase sigma factor [Planctomycetota bacterium]|jgi:RNA polymerase sigma-70 factor (ECF subfamily)